MHGVIESRTPACAGRPKPFAGGFFADLLGIDRKLLDDTKYLKELVIAALKSDRFDVRKHIDEKFTPVGYTLVVILGENVIVGMGLVHVWTTLAAGRKSFIDDIVVHPRFRGQKIGKRITRKLEEAAHHLGSRKVRLTSNEENPDRTQAIRLYRDAGYTPARTTLLEKEL